MFEILDDSSGCRKLGPSKASQTKEVRSSTKLLSCHTLFTPAHTYNVLHFQYNTFVIIITEELILTLSIDIHRTVYGAQTNENRPQNQYFPINYEIMALDVKTLGSVRLTILETMT